MTLQTLYPLALVLHLTGLTLMAGTTLTDYLVLRKFWFRYDAGSSDSQVVLQVQALFQPLMITGMLLLILSGVGMMALTHGVFGEQLWFRIKFGLVLLIIANSVLAGRRFTSRLRKLMRDHAGDATTALRIRRNLRLFHLVQLTCFTLIIILSVFKFS